MYDGWGRVKVREAEFPPLWGTDSVRFQIKQRAGGGGDDSNRGLCFCSHLILTGSHPVKCGTELAK